MKFRMFDDYLNEKLRDPEFAITYVATALEDGGVEEFLYALQKAAIAQGDMKKQELDHISERQPKDKPQAYSPIDTTSM